MSTEQTTVERTSDTLAVQLTSWPIYGDSAFSVFIHLRDALGDDQVCLFESLYGPEADSNRAMIGIFPLLDVTVLDGEITIAGVDALESWAGERLSELSGVRTLGGNV